MMINTNLVWIFIDCQVETSHGRAAAVAQRGHRVQTTRGGVGGAMETRGNLEQPRVTNGGDVANGE